jgi:hypothetical protein
MMVSLHTQHLSIFSFSLFFTADYHTLLILLLCVCVYHIYVCSEIVQYLSVYILIVTAVLMYIIQNCSLPLQKY